MVARDDLSLALGGIRIADIQVPTALDFGQNGGPAFCFLFGAHVPFDQGTLETLHPNHGSYMDPVQLVVEENLTDGYIPLHDAQTTIEGAAQSEIGK
jgi:hypothetical protein